MLGVFLYCTGLISKRVHLIMWSDVFAEIIIRLTREWDERLMGPNICQQVVTFGALGNHLLQPKRNLQTLLIPRITTKVSTVWSWYFF